MLRLWNSARSRDEGLTASSPVGQERGEADLVLALEQLASAKLVPSGLPAGRGGLALSRIIALESTRSFHDCGIVATVSAGASEAATNICWITHDVGEVAESTLAMSSAVEELAASVGELSTTSEASAVLAEAASSAMRDCVSRVGETRAAMRSIDESTRHVAERLSMLEAAIAQIAEMAVGIETISKQTNLLALNATIEAARAGEAGKGFAVVASEVKSLSAQTAKITDQIRTRLTTLSGEMQGIHATVEGSRRAVTAGSTLVGEVGEQIEAVEGDIAGAAHQIRALSDVLGQQRSATSEISGRVAHISGKASKTRGEIDSVVAQLKRCEDAGLRALDEAADRKIEGYPLVRLPADVAAWRRRLASILVGIAPAHRGEQTLKPGGFRSICEDLGRSSCKDHPAVLDLARAGADAERHAQIVVQSVAQGDWAQATPAFVACEEAMTRALDAAARIPASPARLTSAAA